jgi:hypothetical protein
MAQELSKEFDSLNTVFQTARAKKTEFLREMNNLVGCFDETRKNTPAEDHVDGYWAVAIIEDNSNEFYGDSYRQMHPKLMDAMANEKLAIEELRQFLSDMNFGTRTEYTGEKLSAFAVRAGKIIVDIVGRA